MELQNSSGNVISWNAQSLLNLKIGPTVEQVLLTNQTVEFELSDSDTFSNYVITGADKGINNYYQTALISSISIDSDGSSDKLPTYTIDGEGNRRYLDLYVYQKQLSTDMIV